MESDTVEREITVPLPPEEAWQLLTRREHLETWLAPHVELDPQEGGEVRVLGDDGVERLGEVESVDEPHRIRFTWSGPGEEPSVVEISLEPDDEGSRIAITERRIEPVEALARVFTFEVELEQLQGPLLMAA
jgi:uncharacterized protein YndB with AHSA1/START domain